MKSLLSLLPYLRPYRRTLAIGLVFVIGASAFPVVSVRLLEPRSTITDTTTPLRQTYELAGLVVAASSSPGIRYGMREYLNGVSRDVEFDLRNALFHKLEGLDAAYYDRTRTGEIMARLPRPERVRMAAGPAIMYLVNTIASGTLAVVIMLRIHVRLTALAVSPSCTAADHGAAGPRDSRSIRGGAGPFRQAHDPRTGEPVGDAHRPRLSPGIIGSGPIGSSQRRVPRENMRLVYLYGVMNPSFALLAGLAAVTVMGVGGLSWCRGGSPWPSSSPSACGHSDLAD